MHKKSEEFGRVVVAYLEKRFGGHDEAAMNRFRKEDPETDRVIESAIRTVKALEAEIG